MRSYSGSRGRRAQPGKTAEKLCDELELPCGGAHIELMGNTHAIVEGCKGVIKYEEDDIRLNLGKCTVSLRGRGLCVRTFRCEQAVIHGEIADISFNT